MSWRRSLQAAVRALKREESAIAKELEDVRGKIAELEDLMEGEGAKRPLSRGSSRLSPKGRAAISRAAKKRWAEYRRQKQKKPR